jgi:hypothetical protein
MTTIEIIIIIIMHLIVAIVFFYVGKSFSKIIKPTSEEIINYSIENVNFLNKINPIVKEIYLLFVQKDGHQYFKEEHCHIFVTNMGIAFWSENDYYSRHFYDVSVDLLKKYNMTLKELNNSLSLTDKKILDKIVKAVKFNNKEFVNRVFI